MNVFKIKVLYHDQRLKKPHEEVLLPFTFQAPTKQSCLSVFDHFVELVPKRLMYKIPKWSDILKKLEAFTTKFLKCVWSFLGVIH